MTIDTGKLIDVLRCELDVTNQQFTHILVLRHQGHREDAARITQIDDIDFASAMGIVDYLVRQEVTFQPGNPVYQPGYDLPSLFRAEREVESRFADLLATANSTDPDVARLLETARTPREEYRDWLDKRIAAINETGTGPSEPDEHLDRLVGGLITLIEQTMIHAFVEWHGDNRIAADNAWATSGAAMMQLTRLVALLAKETDVTRSSTCAAPELEFRPGQTLSRDKSLAEICRRDAEATADNSNYETIPRECCKIADFYRLFGSWDGQLPHPASESNPPAFHSFARTLERFID